MGVTDVLQERLAAGEVVVVDGGVGTQLQAEGVPMDGAAWCALANLEQPGAVQRVHEAYIRAGAQVIIANTFAAGRAVLEPAGLGGRVAEVNVNAVGAALAAREADRESRHRQGQHLRERRRGKDSGRGQLHRRHEVGTPAAGRLRAWP
jgi:methionine synthase I (cobalamin-dependent)